MLADEAVLATLASRGFRIVFEPGSNCAPVSDRGGSACGHPSSRSSSVRKVTFGDLPYDVWQAGHRVELGLHAYFPRLDYPTVRQLGPAARARLSATPGPKETLGHRRTIEYLLRNAYDGDLTALREPASLVKWLADYHATGESMPAVVAARFVSDLGTEPAFADWDLGALMASAEALQAFLTTEWSAYLNFRRSSALGEAPVAYAIDFNQDSAMQDAISQFVRSGILTPVEVPDLTALPVWARPAAIARGADDEAARFAALSEQLHEALRNDLRNAPWQRWIAAAKDWAALQTIRDGTTLISHDQRADYDRLQHAIDTQFAEWVPGHYSTLATLGLSPPHHVFHVAGFIAHEWRTRPVDRVALLIIDGMALRDWTAIAPVWKERHPDWTFQAQVLLAEVPTMTAVSRQALVSGSRPAHFAASIATNRFEARQWATFWSLQDPALPESACPYLRHGPSSSVALFGNRERAACLIETDIDQIVHGATLGEAEVLTSLQVWLNVESHRLEDEIASLLERGFRVYVASDHGHVEAIGAGVPSEGVIAETRGKRARIYRDRAVAERAHRRFPDTLIWANDGLLPSDIFVLVPRARTAFAPVGERVVTHGGTTIDEMIVPFVTIDRQVGSDGG